MAARGWASSVTTAIGVAAGAGAAQLGLGYGLGIIAWSPAGDQASTATWVNSLVWVAWLASTSTVVGALVADRLSATNVPVRPDAQSTGARAVTIAWRVVIALSAAVGALITVPLVAVPARTPRADNMAPYFTAGGYAVVGVIFGLLIAIAALSARAIATNVVASTAWLWTLAVVAVIDGVRAGAGIGTAQLATWQFAESTWVRDLVNLPGALLMLAIALLLGLLAAWPAGRRGDNRVGVAISGAAGPLLVAGAYLLAAPGMTANDEALSAFVIAPYAVLAGLAGSVLVSAVGPKGARARARVERKAAAAERKERAAADLSDWTKALAAAEAADKRPLDRDADDDDPDDVRAPSTVEASTTGSDTSGYQRPGASTYSSTYSSSSSESARAYAEDTGDADSGSGGVGTATATSPVTGRATVKEPLWPEQVSRPTAPPPPAPGKRGRKKS